MLMFVILKPQQIGMLKFKLFDSIQINWRKRKPEENEIHLKRSHVRIIPV